jgi:hypothetical protein
MSDSTYVAYFSTRRQPQVREIGHIGNSDLRECELRLRLRSTPANRCFLRTLESVEDAPASLTVFTRELIQRMAYDRRSGTSIDGRADTP